MLSKTEQVMWNAPSKERPSKMEIAQINEKYERGEQRIVTETNIEKLPNFVEALKRNQYMELRPFYQRRSRWDEERQSKLIESFIVNIPVPPIFLYERAYNQYEVMDGQQRVTAVSDFYANRFKLKGLELWPELNGLGYSDLPNKIRAGLDRRSISSIVLLKESAPDEEDAILLRQMVFERLNTGGIKLERQEIRNALSTGRFNDFLFELAQGDLFRQIWGLPQFTPEEQTNNKVPIYQNQFYRTMEDIEVVLRFFALRNMAHFRYGIQGFLDLYTVRSRSFVDDDIVFFRDLFNRTLACAHKIYGDHVFRLWENGKWSDKAAKGMYDAVMVPLSEIVDRHDELVAIAPKIVEATRNMFTIKGVAAFTGRASTRKDLADRIDMLRQLFALQLTN